MDGLNTDSPITQMTEAEVDSILADTTFGRLAVSVANVPYIFPINVVSFRGGLLFRTAPGTKLSAVAVGNPVTFEVDEVGTTGGWSIIVIGTATQLVHANDVAEADRSGLNPLLPTRKQSYVFIEPTKKSGRKFVFGPEPDDYVG